MIDSHKYDYLHTEDASSWSYKETCVCEWCSMVRNTQLTYDVSYLHFAARTRPNEFRRIMQIAKGEL